MQQENSSTDILSEIRVNTAFEQMIVSVLIGASFAAFFFLLQMSPRQFLAAMAGLNLSRVILLMRCSTHL